MSENKINLKVTFTFGREYELTPEHLRDRIREISEKFDEIKDRLEELADKIPDEMSDETYDEWVEAIDEIEEPVNDIHMAIDQAEAIKDDE